MYWNKKTSFDIMKWINSSHPIKKNKTKNNKNQEIAFWRRFTIKEMRWYLVLQKSQSGVSIHTINMTIVLLIHAKLVFVFLKKDLSVWCRWRVNNIGKVQERKKKIKNGKYLSAIILGKLKVKLESILQV